MKEDEQLSDSSVKDLVRRLNKANTHLISNDVPEALFHLYKAQVGLQAITTSLELDNRQEKSHGG